MIGSEKTGCIFKSQHYIHSTEVCEAEACMICNEGEWEQAVEMFPPIVHRKPLEVELDPHSYEDDCELDGDFLASGSLVCEAGECGICFKGQWLLPDELE